MDSSDFDVEALVETVVFLEHFRDLPDVRDLNIAARDKLRDGGELERDEIWLNRFGIERTR
jgi:hypothetical protein